MSWLQPKVVQTHARKNISFETSLRDHFAHVSLDDLPCEEVQTGFMCDVAPGENCTNIVQRLIATGMTVARVNMHNLEPSAFSLLIQSIRKAVYNYSAQFLFVYPLAIIVDISGPEIILGALRDEGPIELKKGRTIKLTSDKNWREIGTEELMYIKYKNLKDLAKEDVIFIDSLTSEKIKLIVQFIEEDSIQCGIEVGGSIQSHMSVHIMHVPQEIVQRGNDDISSFDELDYFTKLEHAPQKIAWAVHSEVDAVLISRTYSISDITMVKDYLGQKGKHILVIAAIDSERAILNFDEIISTADGIYLDRIALSNNFPLEKIFVAQKMVMAKCKYFGKPCICRVVMNEKLPSLCASDMSYMVVDGADVLSVQFQYERHMSTVAKSIDSSLEIEKFMTAITVVIRHTEKILWQSRNYNEVSMGQNSSSDPSIATCISAIELTLRSLAVAIICMTTSGRTAKILSNFKPPRPVVAVTRSGITARQLRFWKGISTIHYLADNLSSWQAEQQARLDSAIDYCVVKNILRTGDPFVVLLNSNRDTGYCDTIKLQFIDKARVSIQLANLI